MSLASAITSRIKGEAMACLKYSLARKEKDVLREAGFKYFFNGSKAAEDLLSSSLVQFKKDNYYDCKGVKFAAPEKDDYLLVYRELRDILYEHIYKAGYDCPYYYEGPYEYEEIFLKEGDVVIDAGANIGMFSALASHKGANVFSFEPVPQNQKLLELTKSLSKNITVCPFALSDKSGKMSLSMEEEGNIGSFMESKNSKNTFEVDCITLDEFAEKNKLEKISFIKADIEGAERKMLAGATEVLKNFAPKLAICTYHYPEDPKLLEEIILSANPKYKIYHKWKKLYGVVG
ncbi:MAG: FkbM family methyltransferase [Bacteroidia bacterium]